MTGPHIFILVKGPIIFNVNELDNIVYFFAFQTAFWHFVNKYAF